MTPERPGRVSIEVPTWVAALSDRGVQTALLLVVIGAAGLVGLGLAWSGVAATLSVWKQLAFVVSGGFGGLALSGACLALASVQAERRAGATDRMWLESAIRVAVDVSEMLPASILAAQPPRPARAVHAYQRDEASRITRPTPVVPAPAVEEVPALVTNGRTLHRSDCRMASGKSLSPVAPGEAESLRPCQICRP